MRPCGCVNRCIVVNVPAHDMQALPALRSLSERYTSTLIRCDPSDNLIWSLVTFAKRNQPGWPDAVAMLRLLLVPLTGLYGFYCLKSDTLHKHHVDYCKVHHYDYVCHCQLRNAERTIWMLLMRLCWVLALHRRI